MRIIAVKGTLGSFLGGRPDTNSRPIHDWINDRARRLAYSSGGLFELELSAGGC